MILRMSLSSQEITEVRRIIEENTGYIFKSRIILNQVFRRSSLASETGQQSNEIFEFIGDHLLSYYVVKIIANKFGGWSLTGDFTFKIRENRFTIIKQELVNNETLAKIIDQWGIAKYLLLSRSDIKNDVIKETKVKADLFEAILGAIACETNWNSEILEHAVFNSLGLAEKIESMIENDPKVHDIDIDNAITVLKELAESGQCTMPEYEFRGPDILGYDKDGNPKWECSCKVINDKIGLYKTVSANSKKTAKRAAAYLILCEHLNMQNKFGPNDWFRFWIYKDGKLYPDRKIYGGKY